MRGMAREYAAGNSLGPGWHESAGIFGCPVGGSVADGAVRPGVEWLAAGPRRGCSGDEGAGNEGQALGFSQGQETEIQVGSVVGSATLRDSMCVIHTPIKIGARVQNGSSPLAISWRFDEQCRAVVYDIQPISEAENTLAHTAPAENGQFISPVPGLVPSGGEPMATEDTGVDSSSREERAGVGRLHYPRTV